MKEKILVINDDKELREIIQYILQEKGYDTCEAADGTEGIEQAVLQKPDLILLDILMPGLNGYETCRKLKENAQTEDIPVIFLSSLTSSKDKIQGLELGAVDFINNVTDHGELLARVQTHLKIKSLNQALICANTELVRKQTSLDNDLQAAAIIQKSFLPSNSRIGNSELAFIWLPSNKLGGDIFNAIRCNNHKVILYMIDVSGHDVPSALVTISVSQFLHQQNLAADCLLSPSQMMLALDREYPIERFDRYFTIFYLILNTNEGSLNYSCAGHPPAILLKKDKGLKILNLGGPIIGLNRALVFEEGFETIEEGDKIFLYTDGVIELKNQKEELFGLDRLCVLLESLKNESVDQIIKAVITECNTFSQGIIQQDDISIFGFEFKGGIKV